MGIGLAGELLSMHSTLVMTGLMFPTIAELNTWSMNIQQTKFWPNIDQAILFIGGGVGGVEDNDLHLSRCSGCFIRSSLNCSQGSDTICICKNLEPIVCRSNNKQISLLIESQARKTLQVYQQQCQRMDFKLNVSSNENYLQNSREARHQHLY